MQKFGLYGRFEASRFEKNVLNKVDKLEIILENKELQKVTNHPVHILQEDGNLSPTALIPFCSFNDDFSLMGVKIDSFNVPVCNSFKPKIIKDQLCYQLDPNQFKQTIDMFEKVSFSIFIDYNEDRQFLSNREENNKHPKSVIIETLGKNYSTNRRYPY